MKASIGALWSEFKSFAFKGNMIDLAVAVVIGAAFGKVVTAMVDDIVMPAISYAVTAASTAKEAGTSIVNVAATHTGLATTQPAATQPAVLPPGTPPVPPVAAPVVAAAPAPAPAVKPDPTKVVQFDLMVGRFKVGDFIGSLLNFVIVAFAVFIMIVKLLGSMMSKVSGGGKPPEPGEPTIKECPYCLSNIPIKARKCAQCTADLDQPMPA